MNSLLYLIRKSFKNNLKELLHKPGKMILYLLMIIIFVGLIIMSFTIEREAADIQPLFMLQGILFALLVVFLLTGIGKGLSRGETIFDMSDVNLLFVSPVSPHKILIYGIIRLTRNSFYATFFILFQYNSLSLFGTDFGGVFLILACFILANIVISILALIIYNLTNQRPRRQLAVKLLTAAAFTPLMLCFLTVLIQSGDPMNSLTAAITSPFLVGIPIVGWIAAAITAFFGGEIITGFFFLGLHLLMGGVLLIYILRSKADYFEDSLVATETAFEKTRALAEGNITAIQYTKRKVKVAATGIRGTGVAAIFGKHLREVFRQSRWGFLNLTSLFIIGGGIAAIYFTKNLLTTLQVMMWIQIILINTGRGLQETYLHYLYLIPEPSYKKILWSNMEVIIKVLLENLLIYGLGGLLTGAPLLSIIAAISAATLFSLLLIGINYLFLRFTGANISNGMLLMFYYLAVIIFMAPGLAAAIIIGLAVGQTAGTITGLLILSGWELMVGMICLVLSQGVLDNCDMPVIKKA